jgi:hypothetical protein
MTSTERWLISAIFAIMVGIGSWLLGTVTVNSSRLSVLEQRSNNHDRIMTELRSDIREHRTMTEPVTNGKH